MKPQSCLRSIVVPCVLFALVSMACGSTLPQSEQQAAQVANDGLGAVGDGTLPPDAHINEKGQVVGPEGDVIGTAEESSVLSGKEGHSAAGSTSGGLNGPGVTDDTIALGLFATANAKRANESVGLNLGSFNYKSGWEALIAWQNARGGIAGRRIRPVFFTFDLTSSQTWPQQEQEECTTFTQDHRVFAALTGVFSANILECMQAAGGVVTGLDRTPLSVRPLHRQYPYYVSPVAITLDRAAEVIVDGLYAMRYFASDAKVGVVTFDDPSFRYAVRNGVIPRLRRHGIRLADAAYIHRNQNVSEVSQTSNEATNAALRFKTNGIDHVIFIDNGGAAAYWFTQAAARQDYHPRYGLSSQSATQVLADGLGSDATSQLRRALAIGWTPIFDVREEDDPHAKNSTRVLCLSIMRKAGVEMSGTSGRASALLICDALWSTAAGLDGATVINQSTYLAGMNRLRGAYSPGGVWSTFIDSTRHDGLSSVARMRFVNSCTCFRYSSRPYRIP